jgi:nitroimidazol reductase NimA-like FMN-containing flavoprotein (pyridoxamine 5'-phosphate oxidase superfamily)
VDKEHRRRIKSELIKAGVTSYGLLKDESRHLYKIIHQDEHIEAVVYGRFQLDSVMLIATDKRIIYFDKKPFFSIEDEVPYDMVSGVSHGQVGIFATVTLHTRVGNYMIKYANTKASENFVKYIEKHRLEPMKSVERKPPKIKKPKGAMLTSAAEKFLNNHEVGTLSSIDRTGNIHGAVVYYYGPIDGELYIVTKGETQKAHNIMANKQVALTVYDEDKLQTVQLQGLASLEPDPKMKKKIMNELIEPKMIKAEDRQPPVTKIDGGAYTFIKITPTNIKFYDYKFKEITGV